MLRATILIISAGLSLVLIWYGCFKFTPTEANGIKGLIQNSPLMSWMYRVFSVTTVSRIIGVIEIAAGLALLGGGFSSKLGLLGSILSIATFLVTCSFLLTTGGVVEKVDGLWVPTDLGGFLIKDVIALGASLELFVYYRSM